MGLKLYTIRYLNADKAYLSLYEILKYHAPAGVGLADWRCSKEYKRLLKELGGPILKEKNHNKKLMEANVVREEK